MPQQSIMVKKDKIFLFAEDVSLVFGPLEPYFLSIPPTVSIFYGPSIDNAIVDLLCY